MLGRISNGNSWQILQTSASRGNFWQTPKKKFPAKSSEETSEETDAITLNGTSGGIVRRNSRRNPRGKLLENSQMGFLEESPELVKNFVDGIPGGIFRKNYNFSRYS